MTTSNLPIKKPGWRFKHGLSRTRVHRIWKSMLWRCRNKNARCFRNYGGRGIKVCDRWQAFENFFADMGHPPEGMSIERENNDGDYEPGNCCWATRLEQQRNTRHNRLITFRGETLPISVWAERTGISYAAVRQRISRYGWSPERALTFPRVVRNRFNTRARKTSPTPTLAPGI